MKQIHIDIEISDFIEFNSLHPGEKVDFNLDPNMLSLKILMSGISGEDMLRIFKNGGSNLITIDNDFFKLTFNRGNAIFKFCYD